MVWYAWIITFAIVISLTTYACFTKSDMTLSSNYSSIYKVGGVFIIVPTLFFLIIFSFIYPSRSIFIIICSLVIILYGFYLVWETQMIIGGKV